MKNLTVFLFVSLFIISCSKDEDPMVVDPPIVVEEPGSLKIGLLAHFDFNGNADDVSGAGYQGAVHGATIAMDRHGSATGAYSFDGDDYIDYGNIKELSLGGFQEYTMAAWIKPADMGTDSTNYTVISKFNGGVAAGWYLVLNKFGKVQAYRNVGPWATYGVEAVEREEFVHIAATYDGANLTVYVNGEVDNSVPFSSNTNDVTTPVVVGARHSQSQVIPTFKGVIDDIRIYNRVLTADEFEYLANN